MPNCTGSCDFCLRLDRRDRSLQQIITHVRNIRDNLNYVDWAGEFSHGISLLGGEIYGYRNPIYEDEFMLLVDDIIEKVLKVSPSPRCRYSTVTNGVYDPSFLYRVCDRIVEVCTSKVLDVNFSYDLKYRYKTEAMREMALRNITGFRDRYHYQGDSHHKILQYDACYFKPLMPVGHGRHAQICIQIFRCKDYEGQCRNCKTHLPYQIGQFSQL
jgi:hypothetical protein